MTQSTTVPFTTETSPVSGARPERVRIRARDGFQLGATLWRTPSAKGVVVISSATAVSQHLYHRFAGALAKAGYTVITYDYRGTGGSRPEHLRGFDAHTRDWVLQDMSGVLDWARRELAPARLLLVGHSVGGQLAGMLDQPVDGMVTFSSQSGYWGIQGGEQKAVVALHMHLTLPLLSRAFGYMPWRRLGGPEDLPRGCAREWARWCRDPEYLFGDKTLPLERFAKFDAPVLAYSFSDDKWGTRAAVDEMMSHYPNVERRHRTPADYGLSSIGHFGYFRSRAAGAWHETVAWLDGLAGPLRTPERGRWG